MSRPRGEGPRSSVALWATDEQRGEIERLAAVRALTAVENYGRPASDGGSDVEGRD